MPSGSVCSVSRHHLSGRRAPGDDRGHRAKQFELASRVCVRLRLCGAAPVFAQPNGLFAIGKARPIS